MVTATRMPFDAEPGTADAPPKRGPGRPPGPRGATKPTAVDVSLAQIREAAQNAYLLIGTGVSQLPSARWRLVGGQIMADADKCADAWETAARKDPRIRKALAKLTTGSAYAELVVANSGILMMVALALAGKLDAEPATDPDPDAAVPNMFGANGNPFATHAV